ncbi:nucleolar protein 56-like isoform X1 [Olea europaea var. sylvestris]|uniref:nucleolar protein 56-like isoform X1 n=1 Tax=Olea europaea var. sylvestris TaxID=158386 RepID=UPI000C1D39DF|nr:nucleolar protein 56-like isoform X1 [Olea europaea var. sylvestris]
MFPIFFPNLVHELASRYGLLLAHGLDEIEQNMEAVRNSITDLNRFGKVFKLAAFSPFDSVLDALNQCNAVSKGLLEQEILPKSGLIHLLQLLIKGFMHIMLLRDEAVEVETILDTLPNLEQ